MIIISVLSGIQFISVYFYCIFKDHGGRTDILLGQWNKEVTEHTTNKISFILTVILYV